MSGPASTPRSRARSCGTGPAALLVAATLATWAGVASGQAEQRPEMLLSWNAPYGHPRATDALARDCGAPGADTLYVCYRLSRDEPVFSGLTALMLFHPQFDDTLGLPWKTDEQKPAFIRVEFPRDSTGPFRAGWNGPGVGDWRYYFDSGMGVVRMIYAVPSMNAAAIRGSEVYSLARIILERPPGSACGQGLCVEWMESKVAFSVNAVDVLAEQVHASFVSMNSPGGLACAKYRLIGQQRSEQARLKREAQIKAARQRSAPADTTDPH